jgi:hypothetical protein
MRQQVTLFERNAYEDVGRDNDRKKETPLAHRWRCPKRHNEIA